ncbi:MAG: hypothetical protein GY832_34585 [Chloroflexi bacterium]|nr:hypothetical protein [Chloroflexota bacterium]
MLVEILDTALTAVLIAGVAGLSIVFIFARAGARAEHERMLDDRIARYAGVNREL